MSAEVASAVRKKVLVTGSSRGIGRAIAQKLSLDGFDVIVHCKDRVEEARETAELISNQNWQSRILQFDIANRFECRERLDKEVEENGAFYGVVLNAGMCRDAPFPALEDRDWDDVIGVNLNGFYNVLHPIVLPMIQLRQGGRIVSMSSLAGLTGNRGQVNYSAAKAGIIGATRSLAQELAKRSIAVNCVAPGYIESEMTAKLPQEEVVKAIPMRRLGTSAEVASLVSYLFSNSAGYITGQVISMNGGLL